MEKKKSLRERFRGLSKAKKLQLVIALVLTVSLLVAIPVYAWFSFSAKVETLTKVKAPSTLDIKAGHAEDIMYLDLSDIDVTEVGSGSEGHKDYIFTVKAGSNINSYDIQLAHTTNIPFTYSLYRAKELGNSGSTGGTPPEGSVAVFEYKNESTSQKTTYYYGYASNSAETLTPVDTAEDAKLELTPLNKDDGSFGRTLGKKNDDIYSDYTKYKGDDDPQVYAVPLYSQHTGIKTWDPQADYFILRLSWNTSASGNFAEWNAAKNNKETDMIYLSAKASAQ